jgi:hypothetical protein
MRTAFGLRRTVLIALSVLAGTAWAGRVQAQPPDVPGQDAAKHVEKLQRLLGETVLDTTPFQQLMPLTQFLRALEKEWPHRDGTTFRFDGAAFPREPGLDQTPVRLPPVPKKMSVRTMLRLVASKLHVDVELALAPRAVALTGTKTAAYAAAYEVRDVLANAEQLLAELRGMHDRAGTGFALHDVQAGEDPLWLFHLIHADAPLRDWETLKVVNDSKLVVYATPSNHQRIADLLLGLRRLADLAVVMHAAVYEVDRDYYVRYIAPLLGRGQKSLEEVSVIPVQRLTGSLLQQKVVLRGDDLKIRPGQKTVFLSLHEAFRESVLPEKVGKDGVTGFTFAVEAAVSADRRFLRLNLTRQTSRLVDGGLPLELPKLRKTSAAATVQAEDGQAILLPLDYRPPDLPLDRVWVLLARPAIFIQEEEDQLQLTKDWWSLARRRLENQGDAAEALGPAAERRGWRELVPPAPLPGGANVERLLQRVVADVLTNHRLREWRELLAPNGGRQAFLINGDRVAWPQGSCPAVPGFALGLRPPPDPFRAPPPLAATRLGIELRQLAWAGNAARPRGAVLEVALVGVGGGPGDVLGSRGEVTLKYTAKRTSHGWQVTLDGVPDGP